jgi:hypothetical protein
VLLELIITALLYIPSFVLSLIPLVDIQISPNLFRSMLEMVRFAMWLFPIGALLPIVIISISMDLTTVQMAVLRLILRFIPGLGG